MTHASIFTGIGGFDLAAEASGFTNVFAVEKDKYCKKIIKQNFPDTTIYGDIYEFDATRYKGQITVLSGGFPCQPFSVAGKQRGKHDDRYLWPQFYRVIKECRPTWVIAENVAGIITMGGHTETVGMESQTTTTGETDQYITEKQQYILTEIIHDFERAGYDVEIFLIPALAVGAKHRRNRIWIVGHAKHDGSFTAKEYRCNETNDTERTPEKQEKTIQFKGTSRSGNDRCSNNSKIGSKPYSKTFMERKSERMVQHRFISNTTGKRIQRRWVGRKQKPQPYDRQRLFVCGGKGSGKHQWPIEPNVGRVANGIPRRVDRIKALGNAIVPQVAYEIFYHINLIENGILKNPTN